MTLADDLSAGPQWTRLDREMMSLALQLARKGQYTARPNPMVGCVLVKEGQIIAQGWHEQFGRAHAEVNALAVAGENARGATCYVILEPCAHTGKTGPCAEALREAGVSRVVAAMQDPNPQVAGRGFQRLRDAGVIVQCGLYEAQAEQINRGFISRLTRKRPFVTCKLAMSLDGRTALADGASQWITGAAARRDVQKLRARQDAIITGVGTVLADNPSLTVRAESENATDWFAAATQRGFRQPARVLLDRQQRATLDKKIFNPDAKVFWVSGQPPLDDVPSHIEQLTLTDGLDELLRQLGQKEMNQVLIEAGHQLAGAFLKANLLDELVVFMAPKLMGNQAQGLFDLTVDAMDDTPALVLTDVRQFDEDLRLTYRIKNEEL